MTAERADRDYNSEIRDTSDHKYVYGFDFDVMHPLMIRSFLPFFRPGNVLELGSYKGDFTDRLLPHFSDVTCVEASGEALEAHRARHGDRVRMCDRKWLPDRDAVHESTVAAVEIANLELVTLLRDDAVLA